MMSKWRGGGIPPTKKQIQRLKRKQAMERKADVKRDKPAPGTDMDSMVRGCRGYD